MVGKVPSPGGSESQVPSIQDRGSITGFSWGVSVEEEEITKKENSGICLQQGNTKRLRKGLTQQYRFSPEQRQLQGARGDREQRTATESRSVFKLTVGLT